MVAPPSRSSSSSPHEATALRTLDEPVQRRPPVSIRTIIIAISGVGFVGGLGGAFLYMMRKGRIEAAREAEAVAAAGLRHGSSRSIARESPVARGLVKGGRRSAPLVKGRPVGTSIFDGDSSTPPPFALRKAPVQASAADPSQATSSSKNPQGPFSDEEEQANGPFIAIKAFGIATAMVGFVSLVTVEICRRLFKIKDLDDLVDKLQRIAPENKSAAGAYDTDGNPQIALERKDFADHLDEALGALGQAESVEDWFRILKRTLDAERQTDVAERWQRVRLREGEGQASM